MRARVPPPPRPENAGEAGGDQKQGCGFRRCRDTGGRHVERETECAPAETGAICELDLVLRRQAQIVAARLQQAHERARGGTTSNPAEYRTACTSQFEAPGRHTP